MRLFVVTGASKGIGAAIVDEIASNNQIDKIMAIARGMPLKSNFKNVSNLVVDLSSQTAIERLGDSLRKHSTFETYDEVILINCAGVLGPVDFFDKISIDELKKTFEINTFAPVYLSSQIMKFFSSTKVKIIHISSGVARYPMPNWAAYCMSKAALDMHAQVVREEKNPNVSIVSVAPGIIDTKMQEEIRAISSERFVMKDKFVHYKESGKLKTTNQTAKEIIALVDRIDQLEVLHHL